ncbi:hypothetical protein QBC32DRAFT_315929 [Pseudoneurospora amorphoporcata]|uniref:Uncharacterized protein n=1 Tax=Pseudoneurospora amorphoporcata TaxID=241081 RepID=A0AAN6NSK8_9PEZI|nr:hypothetical protein QBC32DRAFT_315929 [Pseudoneurospora amorphoporcata]
MANYFLNPSSNNGNSNGNGGRSSTKPAADDVPRSRNSLYRRCGKPSYIARDCISLVNYGSKGPQYPASKKSKKKNRGKGRDQEQVRAADAAPAAPAAPPAKPAAGGEYYNNVDQENA